MGKSRKRRSVVWSYFKTTESQSVQCLLCSDYLLKRVQSSTSTMLNHLRIKHPVEFCLEASGPGVESTTIPGLNPDGNTDEDICAVVIKDCDSDSIQTLNEATIMGVMHPTQGDPGGELMHAQTCDDPPTGRVRPKRSLIWKYFERLEGLSASRCHICMKDIQCGDNGGTSNLRRHVLKRHPHVFSELLANGQPSPHSNSSQDIQDNGKMDEACSPAKKIKAPALLKVPVNADEERIMFRKEMELIDALRRTQREEARTLEHQRELLEKLRSAGLREAAAERKEIELLRIAQQVEAEDLKRQREELQREKSELRRQQEELQLDREQLLSFKAHQT
ncbi:uncharacterized protein LOC114480107 [Gouania willdenowi]|uniref:Uncharacterized LOC114480107 n=1 Tax=Gouania willdenowi TaxID=441366 RepID=A0A8C5I5B2_GOUWI|nr:uncharacterized protein LOC114480107 [Gouania willdenowi]